ncbi:dihydrodipicolinate synthase family protein [Nocardia flavorosea]|uniref:Dihydrodipicolinate synthase family protein n=1 Tax=Nocardia flavorosea TaxID=53429 RepID=A0A846YFS4_9NOCA|nr:dihydrodipicolinate synthase family protein [Nocardia flavorosea]NKY57787.1 dihydrodipicolinate synthase family protein [Nocardia flavorosea]
MTAASTGVSVVLPLGGRFESYVLGAPGVWTRPARPITSRVAFAAAHVIPRATADNTPGAPAAVDWDATLAYRHELWSYGLGVADAMDTAQRGMGLDWQATAELIRRSGAEAASAGGRLACGAGTDQLDLAGLPTGPAGLAAIVDAYREQIDVVTDAGAQVILMASRALVQVARSAADYVSVYEKLLAGVDRPVILHWLGTMFDPALHGYWGSADIDTATETFRTLIENNRSKIDGVKVSLLDAAHEIDLRRALPEGVRLYTGDDFNYPELIIGDAQGHSDALLGIFAAIYPAASTALQELDNGNVTRASDILGATQALGRHIFAAPTYYYKTGIAFLSWLNGKQPGFSMVGGLSTGRSVTHLAELFRLADKAGLFPDPELAAHRMRIYLELNGLTS